jgi:hypothetical protein
MAETLCGSPYVAFPSFHSLRRFVLLIYLPFLLDSLYVSRDLVSSHLI